MEFIEIFERHCERRLEGRYITDADINPLLFRGDRKSRTSVIGKSVEGRELYSYDIGHGEIRILMWSQMHGNESTATKAIFDLVNLLEAESDLSKQLLEQFTFCIVPMLNPDGALHYTRENANKVDLNRDFVALTQPESRALVTLRDEFKPDICYNLHDQRTIFGVADTGLPATVSFLSPAFNAERDFNQCRIRAIDIIIAMNRELQKFIPGQVGRFDDAFNLNCVGDNFQSHGIPTILIEAGHFQNDYEREQTRKYIFIALLSGLVKFNENVIVDNEIKDYLKIPQNKANFYDIVYRNVKINYDGIEKIANFAVNYIEVLENERIEFRAIISKIDDLDEFFGHVEYDAQYAVYSDNNQNIPKLGQNAEFLLDKTTKVVNGLIKMY